LQTYSVKSLLPPAWDLAERFHITVYDSLYLALAVGRGVALVTADRPLYDSVRGSPLVSSVTWVEHIR